MNLRLLGKRSAAVFASAAIAFSAVPMSALALSDNAAGSQAAVRATSSEEDYTQYVNTFVGTDVDGGQLFPGAITPSGLVKLSPDTYPHDDDDHAGYDYSKTQISGFSHTRVEGVGGTGAGGDLLVTPTYINTTKEPTDAQKGQVYSHSSESAEPGYYQVELTPKTGTGSTNNSIGKINAEMTTNNNVGLHRYTFPAKGDASLVLDLGYGYNQRNGRSSTMNVKSEGGKTYISGSIQARTVGNKTTYKLYYYAETNIAADSVKTWGTGGATLDDTTLRSGSDIGAVLHFNVADGGQVMLKTAMSTISEEQAKRDLEARMSTWDFDAVRADAKAQWNKILSRVSIKTADRDALEQKYDEVYDSFYKTAGNTPDSNVYAPGGSMKAQAELTEAQEDERLKILFYTHLYHMFTTPVNATSSDNTFRVNSSLVKTADDYTYYDSWSLWDDFRKYPVLGLVAPDVYKDQIKSIANLAQYGVGNLYNNTLSTNTVPTVRAEHAIALLADGVAKGFIDIDNLETAYERFKTLSNGFWGSANLNRGYFSGNVGNTVEYSYDDWALSLISRRLNKTSDIAEFSKRALNYRNLFRKDALTKSYTKNGNTITDKISILWPKDDNGNWRDSSASASDMNNKAEQYEYSGYQGTLWQYSLWDSYDISGLMRLMGDGDETVGKENFLNYMKYLYGMNVSDNASYSDLQNAVLHSNTNEIDLQTPYMFNVAGKPSLTQYWTRQIYTKATWNRYSGTGRNNTTETNNRKPVYAYKLDPYGFMETMDDDCGTMAGNFVAAAMGLYPMTPGDTTYQISSPFFEEMSIDLGNGKTFTIKANGVSSKNFYIQSAKLNGKALNRSWIDYSEIARGGVLEFTMGSNPSDWAENGQSVPSVDDLNGMSVAEYLGEPALEYSKTSVGESAADNGTIADTVDITAKNGVAFTGTDGEDMVASGKVVVSNLPNGLTAKIIKKSSTLATLSFEGAAADHDSDVDDLAIAFTDSAFDGLTASEVVDSYKANLNALVIDFSVDQKARLQQLVNTVEALNQNNYTSKTYTAVSTALKSANETLAASSASDDDYINAYEKLYSAYIALEKKASAFDVLLGSQADSYKNCSAGSKYVVNTKDGSYISYNARDFGTNGVAALTVKYEKAPACAKDSCLEIRKGSATGDVLKTITLPYTGDKWKGTASSYKVYFSDPSVLTGLQDLYAVFKSSDASSLVCRLYEIEFTEAGGYGKVEAENYTSWSTATNPYHSDVLKTENGATGQNIGGTFNGAWIAYGDINFAGAGLKSVSVNYTHNSGRCGANAKAEFRLDAVDGDLFATVNLPSTGSNWNTYKTATANVDKTVTGKHTVYVVLRADTSSSNPFVSNIDYFEFAGTIVKTDLDAVINAAQALESDKYTKDTYAAVETALAAAQKVSADANACQEAVDAAADELSKAVDGLEKSTTSIMLSSQNMALKVGESKQLAVITYVDSVMNNVPVTFTSSNIAVATVSEDGFIKAVGVGKADITVRPTDGSAVTAVCAVTVTAAGNNTPNPVINTPKNGTKVINGKTVLYKNGKAVTGTKVVTVSKKTYAVVKGYVAAGKGNRLVKIGKKSYIVNKNGIVIKNGKNKLVKVGKKSYIVNKSGVVLKNKKSVKVGKKTYKINKKGIATAVKKK